MKTIRKEKLTNYSYIHHWNNENHPKSGICKQCSETESRHEWALIHGKEHARGIDNYMELCKKCHIAYDKTEEWEKRKLNSLSKTPNHQNRIKLITCARCFNWFTPRRKTSKYCSNSCSALGCVKWKILTTSIK